MEMDMPEVHFRQHQCYHQPLLRKTTFNRLLLEGDTNRPRVAEVVAEAGVARSTFYDHFDGVEALYDESLSILFGHLAKCLVGSGSPEDFQWWIAHIYENRARGRTMLAGPAAHRSEALFARLLMAEMDGRPDAWLHAILIAGTVMAALSAWVSGRLSATPEDISRRLLTTSSGVLAGCLLPTGTAP